MSTTTNPAIVTIPNAPQGIVRLFVPEGIDVSKSELRTAAARVAGTIDVGRTPAAKSATYKGVKGHGFDFAPVARSGKTEAAPAAPAEDPRAAALRALGLSADQVAAALAMAPSATPAAGKGKGKGKDDSFRRLIVQKAEAREAAAKRCSRCLGFGKIRTTPRPSGKYPYAFRTANGAATAPTGKVCDACGGQSVATA